MMLVRYGKIDNMVAVDLKTGKEFKFQGIKELDISRVKVPEVEEPKIPIWKSQEITINIGHISPSAVRAIIGIDTNNERKRQHKPMRRRRRRRR